MILCNLVYSFWIWKNSSKYGGIQFGNLKIPLESYGIQKIIEFFSGFYKMVNFDGFLNVFIYILQSG